MLEFITTRNTIYSTNYIKKYISLINLFLIPGKLHLEQFVGCPATLAGRLCNTQLQENPIKYSIQLRPTTFQPIELRCGHITTDLGTNACYVVYNLYSVDYMRMKKDLLIQYARGESVRALSAWNSIPSTKTCKECYRLRDFLLVTGNLHNKRRILLYASGLDTQNRDKPWNVAIGTLLRANVHTWRANDSFYY